MVLTAVLASAGVLTLIPLGGVHTDRVEAARAALSKTFVVDVRVGDSQRLPKSAFYAPRKRYRSERILAFLEPKAGDGWVVGITASDLSTTAHGHHDWGIKGQAYIGGRAAVVSDFRAKADRDFVDTVLHETGHLFGLEHCALRTCRMRAWRAGETSLPSGYCPACSKKLGRLLR